MQVTDERKTGDVVVSSGTLASALEIALKDFSSGAAAAARRREDFLDNCEHLPTALAGNLEICKI